MHDAVFDPDRADTLTYPGERLDDLHLHGLHILQRPDAFCFGIDAVLLSDFASIARNAAVADFGTGTGILPLLLWGREKGMSYEAFERDPVMADMARRSMALNGLTDIAAVHAADVEAAPSLLLAHSMDAVVCNPPYGLYGGGTRSRQQLARCQDENGLTPWFRAAQRILRGKGRISLIYPVFGLADVLRRMEDARLTPKRLRMVYPSADRPAKLVLIEGIYQAKLGLQTEAPLILQTADGRMTDELRRIYLLP